MLIVRGRANLLNEAMASEDLDRVRQLLDEIESKRGLIDLLTDAEQAEGVRIFIGSENKLFSLSGSSVILSPYKDANDKVVGVLGGHRPDAAQLFPHRCLSSTTPPMSCPGWWHARLSAFSAILASTRTAIAGTAATQRPPALLKFAGEWSICGAPNPTSPGRDVHERQRTDAGRRSDRH